MIRHNETKRRLETKAGRDRLNEFRALLGRSREIDEAGDNVDDEDETNVTNLLDLQYMVSMTTTTIQNWSAEMEQIWKNILDGILPRPSGGELSCAPSRRTLN